MFKRLLIQVVMLLTVAGSAWAATLDLGSGSGPVSTTVTIPITLTNSVGTSLAGVSVDIGFDAARLGSPTALIGPAGTAAGKIIVTSSPSLGVFRVGVTGFNTNVIGDGVVANATFTVVAAGSATLLNTPSASDPAGNPVVVTGAGGAINGIGTNQTITFGAAPTLTFNGAAGALSATATSGLSVAFSSLSPSICTVALGGTTVTPVAVGTCTVAANQAGNATFNAAPQVTQIITVAKASQTIAFGAPPTLTFNGATGIVSATGGGSGNPVVFSSATPGVCGVVGSTVSPLAAGTCTIAADQAGNANFNAAAQVTQSITVAKAGQTIGLINFVPGNLAVGGTTTVSATATSGLPVTFSTTTPTFCSVSGTTVSGIAGGTCIVAADQIGGANFLPANQVTQSIVVALAKPGVPTSVTAIPGNTTATVSFTAPSNGGSPITSYTVTSNQVAPVVSPASNGTSILVTGLANGTPVTFTVSATNAIGTGSPSAPSTAVTPNILTATVGLPSQTFANAAATVNFDVTYVGADVITLSAANVTLNKTGTATGTVTVTGTGLLARTVSITNATGEGTLGISIAAGTATAQGGAIVALASTPSATFTVDNTVPALTVNTLPNNSITNPAAPATLPITGTASDLNLASLTLNGSTNLLPLVAGAFSTAMVLADGPNTVTIVATDKAGNSTTDTRIIILDRTAPGLTILTPTDQSFTAQQTATVSGTIGKPGTVMVQVNQDNPQPATITGGTNFSLPVTLALGANTISVTATNITTDGTPTTTSAVSQTHVTFDNTKPALSITDPGQDITTTLISFLVKGTVTDPVSNITLAITVDGVAVTPAPSVTNGAFQQTVSFTAGKTYAVAVTATDQAGNAATVQRNIIFRPIALADAVRALRIAVGIDTKTDADNVLDVAPLVNSLPSPDGVIDVSDAVALLRRQVGLLSW